MERHSSVTVATTTDIRRHNRAEVLEALVRQGPATRLALANETALSGASAANMVQDLMVQGLVREEGVAPSNGGRPSALVRVVEDAAFFLGVDVGEAGVAVGLYDLSLAMRDVQHTSALPRLAAPDQVRDALATALAQIKDRNRDVWDRVKGLGLGLAGIVDTKTGESAVLYAQNLGWPPIAVADLCPDTGLPVTADNGAKAYARAELWRGAIMDQTDAEQAVVVLLGSGVGMGLINQGRIMTGLSSSAGELGHTKVARHGRRCTCGAEGCLEAMMGGGMISARWADETGQSFPDEVACARHVAASADTDPVAAGIIDEAVDYLAMGLASVVNLLNPGICVIGGWLGELLMTTRGDQIQERTMALALTHPAEQVRIVGTRLGRDGVALGGAIMAYETYIGDLDIKTTAGAGASRKKG